MRDEVNEMSAASRGSPSFMGEVYDEKGQRYRYGNRPEQFFCSTCGTFGGHRINCPDLTLTPAVAAFQIDQLRSELEWARNRAATLLDKVRIMHGKVSTLKHENNKLRRANEVLRAKR